MNKPFSFLLVAFFSAIVSADPNNSYFQLSRLAGKYDYTILVEGKSAGKQTISIQTEGTDTLVMETEIEMNIDYLLFFTYSHKHKTREVWRGGAFVEIQGDTEDDGDTFQLNLKSDGKQLVGTGPKGSLKTPIPLATNNGWNLGVLFSRKSPLPIMNPETGEVAEFAVEKLSDMTLSVSGKEILCQQIRLGEQSWKFWFSSTGMLVKQENLLAGNKVEIILNKIY